MSTGEIGGYGKRRTHVQEYVFVYDGTKREGNDTNKYIHRSKSPGDYTAPGVCLAVLTWIVGIPTIVHCWFRFVDPPMSVPVNRVRALAQSSEMLTVAR